jgi:hypothetical protein
VRDLLGRRSRGAAPSGWFDRLYDGDFVSQPELLRFALRDERISFPGVLRPPRWLVPRGHGAEAVSRTARERTFNGIIALTAPIGSDHKKLAELVARDLNLVHASFGRFVRLEARRQNLPTDLETLQEVGHDLHRRLGASSFVQRVLAAAGAEPGKHGIVIDGIRHADVRQALIEMTGRDRFIGLFYDPDDELRQIELEYEDLVEEQDLRRLESHPTEIEVWRTLRKEADKIVSGTLDEAHIATTAFLSERLQTLSNTT